MAQYDAQQAGSKSLAARPVPVELKSLEDARLLIIDLYEHLDRINRETWRDIHNMEAVTIPAIPTGGGVSIDFDIPLIRDCNFEYLATNKIKWYGGQIEYAGDTYDVTAGNSDEDDICCHIDFDSPPAAPGPLTMEHSATATAQVGEKVWFFAYRDGEKVYEVIQNPIIHGGLIQANTITATQIAANTITAAQIAVGTITATEIATNTLTATEIATNAITADELDVANVFATSITVAGSIHSANKTTYGDNDAGWWIGMDGATAKLNFGDASHYLKWDGTDIWINGKKGNLGDGTTFDLDVTSGAITLNYAAYSCHLHITGGYIYFTDDLAGDASCTRIQPNEVVIQPNDGKIANFEIFGEDRATKVLEAGLTAANVPSIRLLPDNDDNYILLSDITSDYIVKGCTLWECTFNDVELPAADLTGRINPVILNGRNVVGDMFFTTVGGLLLGTLVIPGAANESVLTSNATIPVWVDSEDVIRDEWVQGNTYGGDGNATQAITHGLGRTPRFIVIGSDGSAKATQCWSVNGGSAQITAVGATTFTVNGNGAGADQLNTAARTYNWICF